MKKTLTLLSALFLLIVNSYAKINESNRNDDLFPPAPAAKAYIDFDGEGFIINGKRTFITSGSIHYPRVPKENWRDILLKLKRCGFNTVETYIFWNYHEEKEGVFDFTSEGRDFEAFFTIAQELGLYVIVRVGPYVCSEWENGGYPTWLSFKAGLEVRKNNEVYFKYVDLWFTELLPRIAKHQIHKGGNIILVQLENEMPTDGWTHWGTNSDGPHLQHLLDLAIKNGLEVPMFFSGLHHGHDPAPQTPINSSKRKSPWISMELWTIWFDHYGNKGADLKKGERTSWRVLSQGGNGFNLYMFHGGTTFGHFSFNNDIKFGDHQEKGGSSYDFGTLVGQAGDTRALYFRLKRLAYQAESYSSILSHSNDATDKYIDFAKGVNITARTAPEGTLVFLDSPDKDTTAVLKNGVKVKLSEGEIAAFARNMPLTNSITLYEASTRVLGIVKQGKNLTLVCFGETGDTGGLSLKTSTKATTKIITDANFKFNSDQLLNLSFQFPNTNNVGEEIITFDDTAIRILVVNKETADQTWFADTQQGKKIVIGAPYLGEFNIDSTGKMSGLIEYPWNNQAPKTLLVFGDKTSTKINITVQPEKSETGNAAIVLTSWEMSPDHTPDSNADTWFGLPDGTTPEIGRNGNNLPYAWYRTELKNKKAIKQLAFNRIGDRAAFFIDGKFIYQYDFKVNGTANIPVNLPKGTHQLTVFTAHAGRRKFDGHVGSINTLESKKGLCDPILALTEKDSIKISHWKIKTLAEPGNSNLIWSSITDNKLMPAFYCTKFILSEVQESGKIYRIITDELSYGSIWLNGHYLGRYPEILKNCPGIWLPGCWMNKGENSIIIYDEQGKSPEKVKIIIESEVSRHQIKIIN